MTVLDLELSRRKIGAKPVILDTTVIYENTLEEFYLWSLPPLWQSA